MFDLAKILEQYLHPNFPKWMICSRVTTMVFAVVIVGLDAFAISKMNNNPFLGPPAFTGLNMFTVSSCPYHQLQVMYNLRGSTRVISLSRMSETVHNIDEN
jgi:hypothetical protein